MAETLYLREPEVLNHKIKRNGGWLWHLEFTQAGAPFDLTGYTVRCSFVDQNTGAIVVTPTVNVIDTTGGVVELSLTKTQTETTLGSATLNYDFFLDSSTDSLPVFEGVIEPMPGYTP